ncbi:MlaA family lipoprotein [Candidatus Methylobacter oryzae]|uniref:VacJ family lipoprotein n=1 Tax=Candidatus Methylobacter oryzae TaxID=2497749 RepID=A0ABY3CBB1_9GAMM|nr:VacJ family lipoprotein [Candidatus Methylobacter oryzae]TRW95275.1 VacJ family lipoprotein [Candidatus Methylobacter oryzae]
MNNRPQNGNRRVRKQHALSGLLIGVAITLSGCATTEVIEQQTVANKADPYESFNRKMFALNDNIDNYVAEPISNAYKWITPQFMQTGVFNFFNNLKNVNVVINDVLQAKFSQSAEDTGRFAINSTVGLGGLFDVAKHMGLEQNEEDFDQTLAVWGVPQGSYLVLPILGPSTARGIPGAIFDTAANPASYVGMPVQLVSMLNSRASAEGALKFIDEAALDPYVFTRESFLQWRNNLATDGKAETSSDVDGLEDEVLGGDKSAASVQVSSNGDGKADLALQLDAKTKEITQVSHSFSSVAQSFDNTAKSFEDAGVKLDQLKKSKKRRR